LEGSGAEYTIMELAQFVLKQPIPIHFNDDLQPTSESNRCLTATVLTGYIGKYLKYLRKIDPDHPDWIGKKENEYPSWWTEIRPKIIDRAQNNQIKWQGKLSFGVPGIRALYLDLDAHDGDHPLKYCDLKHVIMALVKEAKPSNKNIEMAAKIMMTYDSVARGGEVKFQKFSDWSFDYMTYVLDTKWSETKTCDKYAMPRVPDKRWWFCFFYLMGAYAMCGNGLYRTEAQKCNGFEHTVFPDLQQVSDNYVTTLLGSWIKKGLAGAAEGIEEFTRMYTAKSLRIGAVNELALHAMITLFNACARSGHDTNTSLDSYLDRSNPIYGLPAAYALHGYKHIRAKKAVFPKINARSLGNVNKESMERLVDAMFEINIPEFLKGGTLRSVVDICAASLILHYPKVCSDCGPTNQIASKLEDCAEKAKIVYAGKPLLSHIDVLKLYSTEIKKQFDEDVKKSEMGDVAEGENGSIELLQIAEISSDVKEIKENEQQLMDELNMYKQAYEKLKQDNEQLKKDYYQKDDMLKKANSKLNFLRENSSPVRPLKLKRPRTNDEAEGGDDNVDTPVSTDDVGSNENVAEPPPPPAKKQRNTNRSESINSSTGDANKTLTWALTLMADGNLFHRDQKLDIATIPNDISNKSKMRHCLTLIDFAGDASDIEKLYSEERVGQKIGTLTEAVSRLVTAAMDKLHEFEGNTEGASAHTEKILGLAKRISDYRNKIKKDLSLAESVGQVPLMELSELNRRKEEAANAPKPTALDMFLRRSSKDSSNNDK